MRLLIASDSFKGTYSSAEVASFLKEGVLSVEPDCNVFCVEVSDGAGAAGGLGAALNVFKNVQTVSGADVILKAADFEGLLRSGIDGVITGEGRTDAQTLFGKLPLKVASAAQKYGVPVLLVCGTAKAESDRLLLKGVTKIKPLFQESLSLETLLSDTPEALRKAGRDAVSFFKNG